MQQNQNQASRNISQDQSEEESGSQSSLSKDAYKEHDMISHKSYKSIKSMAVRKDVFNKTQIAQLPQDRDLEMT